jgi:hypothetical protein
VSLLAMFLGRFAQHASPRATFGLFWLARGHDGVHPVLFVDITAPWHRARRYHPAGAFEGRAGPTIAFDQDQSPAEELRRAAFSALLRRLGVSSPPA